jgi:RNA polymerase sigma-70 factor (ECF subfamily)
MATPGDEERLLSEFRASGSRDSLRALLLAHQDRVYNICFQVLGRRQDAEDAAQESLLRLVHGARASANAIGLRRWIYRVSLRAALDVWRRRESTRRIETRSAMIRPAQVPFDDPERCALFEAMERLNDEERDLIVEHYFEKAPLADLGDRRGLSSVAIWKRIDRAREKLKKLLLAAGFTTASAGVADALEATVPATAPVTLLSESLLTKVMVGGAAMGAAKSPAIIGLIAALVLVLMSGAAVTWFIKSREGSPPVTSMRTEKLPAKIQPPVSESTPAPRVGTDTPSATPINEALLAKLNEYKTLYRAWRAEVDAGGPITIDFHGKAREWGVGTQPLIFDDPATFLSFLRDPAHEDAAGLLIGNALNRYMKDGMGWVVDHWKFGDLPSELTDGLLEILKSGGNRLKAALLAWMHFLQEPPSAFDDQARRFLDDPDPALQAGGIVATARGRALDAGTLEKVRQLFDAATDSRVRNAAMDAISRTNSADVQNWIASKLEQNRDPASVQAIGRAAYWRLSFLRAQDPETVDPAEVDRYAAALGRAMTVQKDWFGFCMVVRCALQLPADRAIPVLESAAQNSHTEGEKRAVELVVSKLRAGPVRGNKILELEREFQATAFMK